jgi:hypothetical protein
MAIIAILLAFACRDPVAPDAGPLPIPPPTDDVAYDCGFVSIEAGCAAGPEWLAELDRLGSVFIEPGEGAPSADVCRRIEAALDRALSIELASLSVLERIAAQNGALRAVGPRTCSAEISQKAARAVLRLALPPEKLAELGSEPMSDLEEWLGPRSSWVDRKTDRAPLFHDTMEFFTQAFRPVRSGAMLAVISQMAAVDTAGKVHVTPLVGRIELREHGALDAAACVGKLDASRLRCDAGRVRPLEEEALPHNVFVRRTGPGRVDCNRCHAADGASANLTDLLESDLTERRASFIREAEAMIDSIRRKAE